MVVSFTDDEEDEKSFGDMRPPVMLGKTGKESPTVETLPIESPSEPKSEYIHNIDRLLGNHSLKIGLPNNLYTAIIILPLCIRDRVAKNAAGGEILDKYNSYENYFCLMQLLLLFGFNVALQVYTAMNIHGMYQEAEDKHGECGGYKVKENLRICCITFFALSVLYEVMETGGMMRWLIAIPTRAAETPNVFVIDEETKTVQPQCLQEGISRCYKIQMIILTIVPKCFVAAIVLIFGTGFVVTTNSEVDVLMNCLALVFVIGIDELLYDYFVPDTFKDVIENLPDLELEEPPLPKCKCSGSYMRTKLVFGGIVKAIILVTFITVTLNVYCPAD